MNLRFVLDARIVVDFILKREKHELSSKVIEYLIENKNGYISSSSLPVIYSTVSKCREDLLPYISEIFKHIHIWKSPSYIDFSHPLAKKNIEAYLIHLTAQSLDAFVVTDDSEFISLSDRAISIEEFFEKIDEEKRKKEVSFLNLVEQNLSICQALEDKIDKIVNTAQFVCGRFVKKFEEDFSRYLGCKYCIGVNSGTSALIVALMAIGLKPEDEVIIPVNTFIATAEAVSILGGKPVFVEIDPVYYTIDVTKIEEKITEKTKAIIPVHLFGQCADMDPIIEIAKEYNLWVIEDACQAHGAEYKGKKAGTFGHIGCFSFYPSKNLGSWGEAGACVTNNEELADRMYKIRNHGSMEKYKHELIGGNFKMEEIQGAVLSEKIKFLDKWNEMRREAARLYNELLSKVNGVTIPQEAPYSKHIYHLYVIRVKNRDKVKDYLQRHGIETSIHYPVTLKQVYKIDEDFPIAEKISQELLSLPLFPYIKKEEIGYIVEKLKEVLE